MYTFILETYTPQIHSPARSVIRQEPVSTFLELKCYWGEFGFLGPLPYRVTVSFPSVLMRWPGREAGPTHVWGGGAQDDSRTLVLVQASCS